MKKFKKIKLGSHTISIKYEKTVFNSEGEPVLGESDFLSNTIKISTEFGPKKIHEQVIQHTLFHEITHFILYLMNQHELNGNETFVDIMGEFWSQTFNQFCKGKSTSKEVLSNGESSL